MKSARGAALAYPILRSPRFPVELSPAASRWVPHISRFLRDVGGKFRVTRRSRVGLPPLGNCSALGGVPAHLLPSHISQKTRDTPNFLYAALDKPACAPFGKERRMRSAEPTKLHRKSGIWGTHLFLAGIT